MFRKIFAMEMGRRDLMYYVQKFPIFAILVGASIYLKYITLHFANKSSEKVVKSGCFKRPLHWRAPTVF